MTSGFDQDTDYADASLGLSPPFGLPLGRALGAHEGRVFSLKRVSEDNGSDSKNEPKQTHNEPISDPRGPTHGFRSGLAWRVCARVRQRSRGSGRERRQDCRFTIEDCRFKARLLMGGSEQESRQDCRFMIEDCRFTTRLRRGGSGRERRQDCRLTIEDCRLPIAKRVVERACQGRAMCSLKSELDGGAKVLSKKT